MDDQDQAEEKKEEVQEAVAEAEETQPATETKEAQSDADSQAARGDAEEGSRRVPAVSETSEDIGRDTAAAGPRAEEAEPEKPKKPVSKDLEKISAPLSNSLKGIIESIEKLSVLELADLVHALEDRFGVTAGAPMAVAGAAAPTSDAGEAASEEQTTFNVILASAGANKIGVIKAVRELVPTLGLKEAKDLVEAAPKPVMEGVNKQTANEAKSKLSAAGATVELQ